MRTTRTPFAWPASLSLPVVSPGEHGLLYALADGMGGYAHGGLASALALDALFQTFYAGQPASPRKKLRRSVQSANLSVCQAAMRMGVGRMGTTLTAASLLGNTLYLAHVGDSRAYLVRGGRAICLTNDHTTVGDLVRMKVLSPDRVRTHAQRSVLNKAIGLGLFVEPDVTDLRLMEGDRLILCSDGLWAVIQDDEFARLARQVRGARSLSQDLIDLAIERQTDDNVSAVVIDIRRLAAPATAGETRRTWHRFFSLRHHLYGHSSSP